uniref:Serpentine receptor class gamma n=1 Tax=Caenorhabditis tropicalis TaxID=1561998 RepID=A0A1I7TRN3_9PELO
MFSLLWELLVKISAIGLSVLLDISVTVGFYLFFCTNKLLGQENAGSNHFRYMFLLASFLNFISSLFSTKLIPLINEILYILNIHPEKIIDCYQYVYMFTNMFCHFLPAVQIMTLVSLLYIMGHYRVNGVVLKLNDGWICASIFVPTVLYGLTFLTKPPTDLIIVADRIVLSHSVSLSQFVSTIIGFPGAFILWNMIIHDNKKLIFNRFISITIAFGILVFTHVVIQLASYEALRFLDEPARIALPLVSSSFSFILLWSEMIFHAKVAVKFRSAFRCGSLICKLKPKRKNNTVHTTHVQSICLN